jgi:hypothetical protein
VREFGSIILKSSYKPAFPEHLANEYLRIRTCVPFRSEKSAVPWVPVQRYYLGPKRRDTGYIILQDPIRYANALKRHLHHRSHRCCGHPVTAVIETLRIGSSPDQRLIFGYPGIERYLLCMLLPSMVHVAVVVATCSAQLLTCARRITGDPGS